MNAFNFHRVFEHFSQKSLYFMCYQIVTTEFFRIKYFFLHIAALFLQQKRPGIKSSAK